MSDLKQVKVDNWGIYFLQRLKHFFNRTDYCDLTLQFQDNAQLKVHRLVLSACTEYFELLERTCEMYEDCLIMPDDLQADVVVPIVNFMYTGQLEFKPELLDRLFLTSQVMNMPVLTKLLDAQRNPNVQIQKPHKYNAKQYVSKPKQAVAKPSVSNNVVKRTFSKAFEDGIYKDAPAATNTTQYAPKIISMANNSSIIVKSNKRRQVLTDPKPTRYELPEELDTDNVFENSFCNISYTSQPLSIHPDTSKHYSSKRSYLFDNIKSKKGLKGLINQDIVECTKITKNSIFDKYDDNIMLHGSNDAVIRSVNIKKESYDSSQLFDQILETNTGPKVTIETDSDNKSANKLDHAKIISEVLKKYPHLVKGNKNIKLKILNSNNTKPVKRARIPVIKEEVRNVSEDLPEYTYESDIVNSKEAAKLIALGAENVAGPWICLICGTPGRALNFTSYYYFRRHLVDIHNEKPILSMCEYCGRKIYKRNYFLYHLYTKHGVNPPPNYHFPKCDQCDYIALNESLLMTHTACHKQFKCQVCFAYFDNSELLADHLIDTGHQMKNNTQCYYCLKKFMNEQHYHNHLKICPKKQLKNESVEESEEDEIELKPSPSKKTVKVEPMPNIDSENEEDNNYHIQERSDGIHIISNKSRQVNTRKTILNSGFDLQKTVNSPKPKAIEKVPIIYTPQEVTENTDENEEYVIIGDSEFVIKNNQLIPRNADTYQSINMPTSQPMNINNVFMENTIIAVDDNKIKKTNPLNQIVVSSEEEYKNLVNNHHSIIFDGNDANKTLTLLTTPNTEMETTEIDLDPTQPNDMMIIQEDYPLSVSGSLPVDNSNIMVVYSHSVANENKEYQIITPQDLGICSSTMITQNYATVTNTSPVIASQQILTAQVDESWQNPNTENGTNSQSPLVETQEITTNENQIIEASNEIQTVEEMEVDSNIPIEQHQEEILQEESAEIIHSKNINEENNCPAYVSSDVANSTTSTNESAEQQTVTIQNQLLEDNPDVQAECINDNGNELTAIQKDANTNKTVSNSTSEKDDTEQNEPIDDANVIDVAISDKDNVTLSKVNNDQIDNLASEWSDDDEAHQNKGNDNLKPIMKVDSDINESEHIEESIENIQQEIDKQAAQNEEADKAINIETVEQVDIKEFEQSSSSDNINNEIAPKEKISSLLNDWDENDSQEESISNTTTNNNNNNDEEPDVEPSEVTKIDENEQVEPKKDDKIKSLVSDWDEDEDESK